MIRAATRISNLNELEKATQDFANKLRPRTIVLFSGAVGVGKTQSIRFILKALGFEMASSSSFAIHQEYKINRDLKAHHFDFYRLENEDEIFQTGYFEALNEDKALVFVEWPDLLRSNVRAAGWVTIKFELKLTNEETAERFLTIETLA